MFLISVGNVFENFGWIRTKKKKNVYKCIYVFGFCPSSSIYGRPKLTDETNVTTEEYEFYKTLWNILLTKVFEK